MQTTKRKRTAMAIRTLSQQSGSVTGRRKPQPARKKRIAKGLVTLQGTAANSFLEPRNALHFNNKNYKVILNDLYAIVLRAYVELGKQDVILDKQWKNNVCPGDIMNWLIKRCYEIKNEKTLLIYDDTHHQIIEWAINESASDVDSSIAIDFIDKNTNKYEKEILFNAVCLMHHECQIGLWDDRFMGVVLDEVEQCVDSNNNEERFEPETFEDLKLEYQEYDEGSIQDWLRRIKEFKPDIAKFKQLILEYGKFKPVMQDFLNQLILCLEKEYQVYPHCMEHHMIEETELEESALQNEETMRFLWTNEGTIFDMYQEWINDTANNFWVLPWVQRNTWTKTNYKPFQISPAIVELQKLMSLFHKLKHYFDELYRTTKPKRLIDILSGQEAEESIL